MITYYAKEALKSPNCCSVNKIGLKIGSIQTYQFDKASKSLPVRRNLIKRFNKATLLKAESSMKGVWYDTVNAVYGTEGVNGS